jgi:galactose oxidase
MNGSAVMYDVDKILTLGGATAYQDAPATRRAYTVDVSGDQPVVQRVGDLNQARSFQNAVVLPDGSVLVLGGQRTPVPFSDAGAVLVPELWDPQTGTFRALAAGPTPRTYHSAAVLLPDGRVLSGGGGQCNTCTTNHPDAQVFTPPYLLNADGTPRPRPTLSEAPTTAALGSTVTVSASEGVTAFSLVRQGAATHTVNTDQRRIPVQITAAAGGAYDLAVPSDGGVLPPGDYMLFALDSAGTPSVARTVLITS